MGDLVQRQLRYSSWTDLARERPELVVAPDLGVELEPREFFGPGRPGEVPPRAVLRLERAVVCPVGVIFEDLLLTDDIHFMPHDWRTQHWLPYSPGEGEDTWVADVEVTEHVAGTALFIDVFCANGSFGHFVHDTVSYSTIHADLAERGIDVPALVIDWPYASQRTLADELFGPMMVKPTAPFTIDELLLPARQLRVDTWVKRIPADAMRRVAGAIPRVADARRAAPTGPPVYLRRTWGAFGRGIAVQGRDYRNGEAVDAWLDDAGFLTLDPGAMDVMDVLDAVARAPMVVGVHGAQMTHVLWANEHCSVLEMMGPKGSADFVGAMLQGTGQPWLTVNADATDDGPAMGLDKLADAVARGRSLA